MLSIVSLPSLIAFSISGMVSSGICAALPNISCKQVCCAGRVNHHITSSLGKLRTISIVRRLTVMTRWNSSRG